MADKVIKIHPMTRLEGHGKIIIFLNDKGDVEDAYLQVVEFRGFERFCKGRPVEEMPLITPRICGVCSWAHHMASTKAVDSVYHVAPAEKARKLRELAYNAFYIHDHSAIFYVLSAPDFVVGPNAPRPDRNVLGVARKLGVDVVKRVLRTRKLAAQILQMLGGRSVHPSFGLPGGVSKGLSEDERTRVEEYAKELVAFGSFTLDLLEDVVSRNENHMKMFATDTYKHKTYYMSLVDDHEKVNYYDGLVKVVDPEGKQFVKFPGNEYLKHIGEHVEEWTYLKFPFLKAVGWKGLIDGKDSGIYRVGPLARLNTSEGFATPLADEAYRNLISVLGKPVHTALAYHWGRVLEILNAAERVSELSQDKEIVGKNIRNMPREKPDEGVGIVEAPRGTLIHHYRTNNEGLLTDVNLIVATVHNNAGMCMSVKKSAQQLIKQDNVDNGLLNMVEMAFRAYDPCLACGTHALPGHMPIEIEIYDAGERLVRNIRRD